MQKIKVALLVFDGHGRRDSRHERQRNHFERIHLLNAVRTELTHIAGL